jgi:dTDP-4-dehydrorhamnose reductase
MNSSSTILILGASSWIGYELVRALPTYIPRVRLIGTYYRNQPKHLPIESVQLAHTNRKKLRTIIRTEQPNVIINVINQTDRAYLELNRIIAKECAARNARIVLCSSAMAFDADLSHPHQEDDKPQAQSEYGKAKVTSEAIIRQIAPKHMIVRFSAIHGYSPTKITRTEAFLQKLAAGSPIEVDRHVYQNRLYAGTLANMIAELIAKRATGTIHLGTKDTSEEFIFLQKLAVAFGYPADQVRSKPASSPTHLTTVIKKMTDILPLATYTETQTIAAVSATPELYKYHARASRVDNLAQKLIES